MSTVRTPAPRTRSAVTNGGRTFVDGDGSSKWARRYRDIISARATDLGGLEVLTQAQLSLIKRAATMECELEGMEGQLSRGEEISLDLYTRTAGHLRRYCETLGIKRVPRDVTPELGFYIEGGTQ